MTVAKAVETVPSPGATNRSIQSRRKPLSVDTVEAPLRQLRRPMAASTRESSGRSQARVARGRPRARLASRLLASGPVAAVPLAAVVLASVVLARVLLSAALAAAPTASPAR